MRTFYFSPVLRDAEVSCDPSDGSTLLFQGVQFILCLNLNIIHSHHFFHSSLCACLAFLVLVCCLVCRSCPLARSSIYHHDYQASTRHHLQKCSIYIDCQVVSRQSNKVSSSRNTGPPSFSSENMIIFLMILVISRLVLVGDDHLRLSIQKRSPILF